MTERDKEILHLATVLRRLELGPDFATEMFQQSRRERYNQLLDEKIKDQEKALDDIAKFDQEHDLI